jgi:ATP-dependent Clp protease, protease subunit
MLQDRDCPDERASVGQDREDRVKERIRPIRIEEEDEGEERPAPKEEESKMLEKFLKTRTILISEEITSDVAKRVYQNLLLLEAEDPEKPITIFINSPGGEADSGFGIYDMLRFIRPPIRTVVAGLCASAAVLIFLAAEKGDRLSLPHSRYLLHQPSSASFGQASDLEIAANEIIRLRDRYNQIISDATGKPIDIVAQDADRDFWMAAPQAVDYGLVDRIVTNRSEIV